MPPAARVSDMHTCPMVTVLDPHVGGPILPPVHADRSDRWPAGRPDQRHVHLCGPPGRDRDRRLTVLIGGMPAARIGDMTAHGGVIVMGQFNVIIGDAGSGSGYAGGGAPGASEGRHCSPTPRPFRPPWSRPRRSSRQPGPARPSARSAISERPTDRSRNTLRGGRRRQGRAALSACDGGFRPGLPVRRQNCRAAEPRRALCGRPEGAGATVSCLAGGGPRPVMGYHVQVPRPAQAAAAAFQALPGRQASRWHSGAVPVLDPRVFGPYLASCTQEELALWFDGVSAYLVENQEQGGFHEFTLHHGQLYDRAAANQ